MAKVDFGGVGVDYITEYVEKSLKYHNRIMDSIQDNSSLYLPLVLHEEYTESMELDMQDLQEKFNGIRDHLYKNMRGDLDQEKLIILKEIDTMFEEKGIYKSRGVTSPFNPLDMVKTVLPYKPSEWMKKILANAPKTEHNVRRLKED